MRPLRPAPPRSGPSLRSGRRSCEALPSRLRFAAIASRLDLREPNAEALRAIAYTASHHYEIEGRPPPYECVIDVATGVGKTFVLAAAIEYYAALGRRHFALAVAGGLGPP